MTAQLERFRLNVSRYPLSPWASCAWASWSQPTDRRARGASKRTPINDSWIAATAIAHHLPVAAQDTDYDGVPGLEVIRV
jgi:predicted nucleic acid-binding protein